MDPRLSHIRNWIFDLDNTLYPASARLFDRIDANMGAYIAKRLGVDLVEQPRARRIQRVVQIEDPVADWGKAREHGAEALGSIHDPRNGGDRLRPSRPDRRIMRRDESIACHYRIPKGFRPWPALPMFPS